MDKFAFDPFDWTLSGDCLSEDCERCAACSCGCHERDRDNGELDALDIQLALDAQDTDGWEVME